MWDTTPIWKCVQISVENINNLLIYSQTTVPRGNVTPFEVKGPERGNCSFQLTNSDITQTGILCQAKVQKYV